MIPREQSVTDVFCVCFFFISIAYDFLFLLWTQAIMGWSGLPAHATAAQIERFYREIVDELLSWRMDTLRLLSGILSASFLFFLLSMRMI